MTIQPVNPEETARASVTAKTARATKAAKVNESNSPDHKRAAPSAISPDSQLPPVAWWMAPVQLLPGATSAGSLLRVALAVTVPPVAAAVGELTSVARSPRFIDIRPTIVLAALGVGNAGAVCFCRPSSHPLALIYDRPPPDTSRTTVEIVTARPRAGELAAISLNPLPGDWRAAPAAPAGLQPAVVVTAAAAHALTGAVSLLCGLPVVISIALAGTGMCTVMALLGLIGSTAVCCVTTDLVRIKAALAALRAARRHGSWVPVQLAVADAAAAIGSVIHETEAASITDNHDREAETSDERPESGLDSESEALHDGPISLSEISRWRTHTLAAANRVRMEADKARAAGEPEPEPDVDVDAILLGALRKLRRDGDPAHNEFVEKVLGDLEATE